MGNWSTLDLPGAGHQQPCPAQNNLFSLLTSPAKATVSHCCPSNLIPIHPLIQLFIHLFIYVFIDSFILSNMHRGPTMCQTLADVNISGA